MPRRKSTNISTKGQAERLAIFIDTGVFVAANNKSDNKHERASDLMKEALEGKYGTMYTSDYVIDESVATALARTRDHRIAVNTGLFIIESLRIEKIYTDSEDFEAAWMKFQKLGKKPLSFTDCVSISQIAKRRIGSIMSFDSGFDGLVTRIS
jgi:uncharacterized protein